MKALKFFLNYRPASNITSHRWGLCVWIPLKPQISYCSFWSAYSRTDPRLVNHSCVKAPAPENRTFVILTVSLHVLKSSLSCGFSRLKRRPKSSCWQHVLQKQELKEYRISFVRTKKIWLTSWVDAVDYNLVRPRRMQATKENWKTGELSASGRCCRKYRWRNGMHGRPPKVDSLDVMYLSHLPDRYTVNSLVSKNTFLFLASSLLDSALGGTDCRKWN